MAKPKTPRQHQAPSPSPSPSQLNFLISFPHYIRIDVSAPSTRTDRPFELLEFLRLACIWALMDTILAASTISKHIPSANATAALWPSLFAFSATEAEQSASVRQHRGCFLVGLGADTAEGARVVGERFQRRFDGLARKHRIFVDEPIEPKVTVRHVQQEELGRLVVDRTMWPQPDAQALCFRGGELEASTRYFAPSEEHIADSTKGPGVQQKLRPASDVLHRLRWDPDMRAEDYAAVYLDRFTGYQEVCAASWKSDTSDDEFVPLHRIVAFRDLRTGAVVWSREFRADRIFNC